MARSLPRRTDTPMTDSVPSGSDPASSSSAPTSSNPPTPKDQNTVQVMVDPAFINPDLVNLPDSSSEPVLPAKYFDYADGLERPIHEPDMDVPHPSVPPQTGFVQRVRAMLESKAAAEAAAAARLELENASRQYAGALDVDHDQEEVSELIEYHELAANETPRFTLIEEFDAPVELPASPVKLPELEATELPQRQSRPITRAMVKAELGPSSVDNTQMPIDDTTTHLMAQLQKQYDTEQNKEPAAPDESEAAVSKTIDSVDFADQQGFVSETESIPATLPTGVDYAMRFSRAIDTTVASDETRSRDDFALDVDTITLQEQSSKQAAKEHMSDIKELPTPGSAATAANLDRNFEHTPVNIELGRDMDRTPISPLLPGEEIKRSSAVSPIDTQTLNIDETLSVSVIDKTDAAYFDARTRPDSLEADDSLPLPTPRTPKTYSKSVQLRPRSTLTDSLTPNTNRFSLPGDISTVGDTTLNSGSDMITDIAVRFSLPHGSISIGKPQIVEVSPSSTPDCRLREESALAHHNAASADLKAARRSSVTFADEVVAPLNITKRVESSRQLQPSCEAAANKGRSIIRKSSPATADSNPSSREGALDLRFTNGNHGPSTHKRFGSTHLPGLKEESVEDVSISDHRRSSSGVQFPLPVRIAAVKAMQERRLQESADKAKARRQARQHNRPLGDTRDLPSLNFSRTDLIDRLNEALETRTTTSTDVVRRRDFTGIYCPSPQRPHSTEPLRERYTSFFTKPDEFSFLDEHADSGEESGNGAEPEEDNDKALVPALQIQETTEVDGVEPDKRPLSPEDFLNVAQQASRLSIPTVGGLSDRLSELIPGLRNLSNLQLDSIFRVDREGLHRLSTELARPDTIMTNRTSAGFRTLAERAEEIVKNGTHDSVAPRMSKASLNKELPPLPESTCADGLPPTDPPDNKRKYLSGSASAPSDLARPVSALLPNKAPTTEEEVLQMLPKEMNPITRNCKRSMFMSGASRPWNNDENYPWESKVDIDLSVPSVAHTRTSVTSEVFRERRTKSLDLTKPVDVSEQGIDIGSITTSHFPSSASIATEQLTGITPSHRRQHSKRSIIGSISKKLKTGLSGLTADDDATKILAKSPLGRSTSTRQSQLSHKPGDRYPTSALTPPASFNLDEVRSFFSDNSSDRDRTASFRKRLTGFKGKGKQIRVDQARGQSLDENTAYDGGSMVEARLGNNSRANTYDGVGMSKTEFHIKRFGERLRHLFARGGDLIRSFSTRTVKKRPDRTTDEWLADSVYSGV
ncbi:hypothetical protein DOTSEDRAFT_74748 [Dothistroma septosporum NZE10]|uniref:Uncharacterized protein n=1 Tax=Dothistroma septosporum (strain NZE10 / CBS 128990) TaxID=675120 RepID=N1PD28_DOTSN|nr:hypothetical protein DOTSEDRAFT_74748 [Dothistroma septosporum NZE10]